MNGNLHELKPAHSAPPRGEMVQVVCGGMKHLAYRDWRGNWRCFINNQPLDGDVRVIEYPQGPPKGHIQLNLFR